MKAIFKKLTLILFTFIFIFSNITHLHASSASISVTSSSSKVVVGNTFTVTIRIKSSTYFGTWEFTPSYDKNKLKLTSGSTSVVGYGKTKDKSFTYKFKAIATGSTTISVKSAAVRDYDTTKEMSLSKGSKTITIISQSQLKASYSSNNNLKSLSIDGLTLSPTFNKNTTSYKVAADSNTTKVNIKAAVEDSKASVSGVGTKNVNEGENKFDIVVTAQNGNKKTYTIIVDVKDPNPIEVTMNENKYVVVKRETSIPTLEGFKLDKITVDEQEVPCLYNEINDYHLIALKDSESKIALYIYDSTNNTYKIYEDAKLNQMNIVPIELESTYKPENERVEITIDDVLVNAIKLNANGLYILKARNLEDGKENYYEYDEETNTLIRYIEEEKDDSELIKYKKMLLVLGIETVVVILILVCILIKKMKKNSKRKKRIEEEKNKLLAQKDNNEEKKEENKKEKKKKEKKEVNDDEKENKNI